MTCGIYAIIGPHGEMYVGASINIEERHLQHRRNLRRGLKTYGTRFRRAWKKYGSDAFSLVVLEECARSDLVNREGHFLAILQPAYNVEYTVSGVGGCLRSDEARSRMSEAAKRRWAKPEERSAQSQRVAGRRQSQAEIATRRESNLGKVRSAEQRQRMRDGCVGRVRPIGVFPTEQARLKLKAYANSDAGREVKRRAALIRWNKLKDD